MMRSILVLFFCLSVYIVQGQYHPTPDDIEIKKLREISDKAYYKLGLEPYDKYIIIFYGDLDCQNVLSEKIVSKSLFEKGIKFGYHIKKKCFFKKEKYLAADVYYLNENNQLLGYFDGQVVFPVTSTNNGESMYLEMEKFVVYLYENGYTDIFNLGCALDVSKYYALDAKGESVFIDEFTFRKGGNPTMSISKLR